MIFFGITGTCILMVYYLLYSLNIINKITYLSTVVLGSTLMGIYGLCNSDIIVVIINIFFSVASITGIINEKRNKCSTS